MGGRGASSRLKIPTFTPNQYDSVSAKATKMGININVSDMVNNNIIPQNIDSALGVIEEVYKKYPLLEGFIKTIDYTNKKNVYAAMGMYHDLYLGEYGIKKMSDLQLMFKRDVLYNFHPQGKVESIIEHELGHAIESYLVRAEYNSWAWGKVAQDYILKAAQKLDPTIQSMSDPKVYTMSRSISRYAVDEYNATKGTWSYWETFAEAMADYGTNKEKASPLSRVIGEMIKERMK